jgi:hypothetical protein
LLAPLVEGDSDDVVGWLGARDRVVLADAEEPVARGVDNEVGVAPVGLRRDRVWLTLCWVESVEAVIIEVGEDYDPVADGARAAAVLVDPGADVERSGGNLGAIAGGGAAD